MKQKFIHCDGLGYFYNQATFQSEYCPHCEGKGYIETSHDLGGPIETPEVPVVEAPVETPVETPVKPTKKSTKTTVEVPVEPTVEASVEAPVEPQADVDGSKN